MFGLRTGDVSTFPSIAPYLLRHEKNLHTLEGMRFSLTSPTRFGSRASEARYPRRLRAVLLGAGRANRDCEIFPRFRPAQLFGLHGSALTARCLSSATCRSPLGGLTCTGDGIGPSRTTAGGGAFAGLSSGVRLWHNA